jgi:hypothetical protein
MEKAIRFFSDHWLSLAFLVLVAAAFLLLRSNPTELADTAEFDSILANGEPTIVEFYSNY